jgi:hypothetical protein
MATLAFGRCALTISAAFLFAGCGGSAHGAIPAAPPLNVQREGALRNTPDRPLLYASSTSDVYVLAYPKLKPIEQLTDFGQQIQPQGLCTDRAGDVFVTGLLQGSYKSSVIYEFAHGASTPIAALDDNGWAASCDVDPVTGDLAVANWGYSPKSSQGVGTVAIYAHATGTPTYYDGSPHSLFGYCAYDAYGNLYVALYDNGPFHSGKELLELAAGSASFGAPIKLSNGGQISSVQRDGATLAVSSPSRGASATYIYRVKIRGSVAKIVSTTTLTLPNHHPSYTQFWIAGAHIVGIGNNHQGIDLWPYPRGGGVSASIFAQRPGLNWFGVTVSK